MMPKQVPPSALVGFPLLPVPDENGRLSFPAPEVSVRQAIRVILSTRPGEQLVRPEFGAGLEDLLNEPNTTETRRRVRDLVMDALRRWEPRVDVDRVDVLEVPDLPTQLRVEIVYRLRRTGASQQLGLTMELVGG